LSLSQYNRRKHYHLHYNNSDNNDNNTDSNIIGGSNIEKKNISDILESIIDVPI